LCSSSRGICSRFPPAPAGSCWVYLAFQSIPFPFPSLLELMRGQDQTPLPIGSHAVPWSREKCNGRDLEAQTSKITSTTGAAPSDASPCPSAVQRRGWYPARHDTASLRPRQAPLVLLLKAEDHREAPNPTALSQASLLQRVSKLTPIYMHNPLPSNLPTYLCSSAGTRDEYWL